jgi:hypothetical protein
MESLLRPKVRLEIKLNWIFLRQDGKLWAEFIWQENRDKKQVRVNTTVTFIKRINNKQMRLNFMVYFYL